MRYIQQMSDGTIDIFSPAPVRVVRNADGAVFIIHTIRRPNGRTQILGGTDNGEEGIFDIGPEMIGGVFIDPADTPPDAIPGHTIVFADYETQIKAKLADVTKARIVGHRKGKKEDLPTDYTFRLAWRDTGQKIGIDMPQARNIWRDRMREVRADKLAALDADYLRADESGDVQAKRTIAAKKQALRDVTAHPDIEAAATPEELKKVWPL